MAVYSGKLTPTYTTGQKVGEGGEGFVFELNGCPGLLAKIYKPGRFKNGEERAKAERKILCMISMKVQTTVRQAVRLAWPQDILYENGVFAGFVMPKIETHYKLYDICRDGAVRDRIYPNYNWKYAVQFAYHLAWLVNYLHSLDIVIGDLNPNNLAVDIRNGTVVLLDCDSFDIRDPAGGEHFPCTVGLSEMLPPELQTVQDLHNAKFTKETDCFSLAIHLFRLLMNNADPFGGVITTDNSSSLSQINVNLPIINGECAYVREVPGKKIPAWSPKPEMLPPELLALFRRTFDYTQTTALRNIQRRASAREWALALHPYGTADPNPRILYCAKTRKHAYAAHNASCPWCAPAEPQPVSRPAAVKPQPAVPAAAKLQPAAPVPPQYIYLPDPPGRQKKKKTKKKGSGGCLRVFLIAGLLAVLLSLFINFLQSWRSRQIQEIRGSVGSIEYVCPSYDEAAFRKSSQTLKGPKVYPV